MRSFRPKRKNWRQRHNRIALWDEGTGILRNVNLNLLPILQLLLKTQSVSATAVALGISQPAVSDALARLRAMLEDQLLVRVGSRMNLTAYAEGLIDPLDRVCGDLEAFLTKDSFDPRTARRELVVATSDLAAYLLARPIMDMLMERAPNVSLHLVDLAPDLTSRLASREIDIALLPEFSVEDLAPAPLRFQQVFKMPRAVIMRKGHPLAEKPVMLDSDIARYKLVAFQPDGVLKSGERQRLATNGTQIEIVARLGHAMLLPKMLLGTDFIAVVPQQFAEEVTASFALDRRRFPQADPDVNFGFVWSPVQDRDPAHAWLRQALIEHLGARFGSPRRGFRTQAVLRMELDPAKPE